MSGHILTTQRNYLEWQTLLDKAFFSHEQKSVIFHLDDETLNRIEATTFSHMPSLISAVARMLVSNTENPSLKRIHNLNRTWRSSDQQEPPPILPFLALTVLAATRMTQDGEYSSQNYYVRLSQVLEQSDQFDHKRAKITTDNQSFRSGIRRMWKQLDSWIGANPRVGKSTITEDPRLVNIGYPLSQALVRQADIEKLVSFFDRVGSLGRPLSGPEQLIEGIKIWNANGQKIRASLDQAIESKKYGVTVANVIWNAFVAHQGGETKYNQTDRNVDNANIRIVLKSPDKEANWLIQGKDDLFSGTNKIVCRKGEFNRISHYDPYFLLKFYKAGSDLDLQRGWNIKQSGVSAGWIPREHLLFERNPIVGAWASTTEIDLGEEYLLAFPSEKTIEVLEKIGFSAKNIWKIHGRSALSGYEFTKPFFVKSAELARGIAALDPSFKNMEPFKEKKEKVEPPRLIHGLGVGSILSARTYLVGGEPDVILPLSNRDELIQVSLDGKETTLRANGERFELRLFMSPKSGIHEFKTPYGSLRFRTINISEEKNDNWFSAIGNSDSKFHPDHPSIEKHADKSSSHFPTLFLEKNREWVALLADGNSKRIPTTRMSHSVAKILDIPEVQKFEYIPAKNVQWVAGRGETDWKVISSDGAREYPGIEVVDIKDTWRRSATDGSSKLWMKLLEIGGGRI